MLWGKQATVEKAKESNQNVNSGKGLQYVFPVKCYTEMATKLGLLYDFILFIQ